jgi:hypothetical protein
MAETRIRDFKVWHTYEGAVWNYPANRITIENLVFRHDPDLNTPVPPTAVTSGDYRHINLTIRGGSIHAGSVLSGVTDPLGTLRIENVEATTINHAFDLQTPATPGAGADRPPSGVTVILNNNVIQAWPGQALRTIKMTHRTDAANSQPHDKYEVFVSSYQGQPNSDFRVYFHQQAGTSTLYGERAPCNNTTSRPEIDGITCAMNGSQPIAPPAAPGDPTVTQ